MTRDGTLVVNALLALTLALAGCAGNPAMPAAVPAGISAEAVRAKIVPISFKFHIPRKHRRDRAPRYISPATKSVGITVDAGPRQQVLYANLTPGSPACDGNVCTLALDVSAGQHIFDVRTYDQPLVGGVPHGAVLSENLGFPFKVLAGKPNSIGMVLQGIPAGIAVSQIPDEDVQGDQQSGFNVYGGYEVDGATIFPRIFTVAATDADGNYIVGAGAPQLAMKSANTLAFSDGVVSPTNPNRFIVTPIVKSGFFSSEVVKFTATAGSVSSNFAVQIVAQIAPRLYVTQQNPSRLWVFDERGNPVAGLQSKLDAIDFGNPVGVVGCNDGAVWVAGEVSHSIREVNAAGIAGSTISTTTYPPLGLACDVPNLRLYVALANGPVVVFSILGAPSQIPTTGNWQEVGIGTYPQTPWDLILTTNGVELTDEASGLTASYDLNGNGQIAASVLGYGAIGLAVVPGVKDPLSTSRPPNENAVFDTGGLSLPPGSFPNVSSPFGIRYDQANGYVYVVNYGNSTVTRYDTGGNQVALPAGAFASLAQTPGVRPLEMAIVP